MSVGFNKKTRNLLFLFFLVLVIFSTFFYLISGGKISLTEIQALPKSLGIWFPVFFVLGYIIISIFFPTTPLMALAGIIFGFKYGLFYTVIAGFVSSIITFYIARFLGKEMVDDWLNSQSIVFIDKYNKKIEKHGFITVIVLRTIPIMPFNVLNLLLGISRVKKSDYILGTLLGLVPSNILAVYFGIFIVSIIL